MSNIIIPGTICDDVADPKLVEVPDRLNTKAVIHCYCGITRVLPMDITNGEPFRLKPCPVCKSSFKGILRGDVVEAF